MIYITDKQVETLRNNIGYVRESITDADMARYALDVVAIMEFLIDSQDMSYSTSGYITVDPAITNLDGRIGTVPNAKYAEYTGGSLYDKITSKE